MGLRSSRSKFEHVHCDTQPTRIKCRCTWAKHISNLHSWAYRAQKEGNFCDFRVEVGNETFRAHSIIIACHSGLFRRVAKSSLSKNGRVCIRVDNVSSVVLGKLLDYAYTGQIELNKFNVAEISKAAIDFEMVGILRICLDFIANMDVEQALLILRFSNLPKSNLIFRRAFDYSLSNFASVYVHPIFNDLDENVLSSLLRSDDLVINSEMVALDALLQWTHHDFEIRKNLFKKLVQNVRFCQMDMDELVWASSLSDLLPKYCHKMLIHANWLVTLRHIGYRDPIHLDPGKPRNCLYHRDVKKKKTEPKKYVKKNKE